MRTTGTTDAGGGFDPSYGGTDYSQQDAPQLTLTDGSTNTGNTTLSSVIGGFTAAMLGNVCTITQAGTFRGFGQIVGFTDTHTVTLFSNGPITAANCTIKLGGAILLSALGITPFQAGSAAAAGQKVWIKAGTYALITTAVFLNTAGTATRPLVVEGYTTTRGDGAPTLPVLNLAGAPAGTKFTLNLAFNVVRGLKITNVGDTATLLQVNGTGCVVENCEITPGTGSAVIMASGYSHVRDCLIHAPTSGANPCISFSTGPGALEYNAIVGNSTATGLGVRTLTNGYLLRGNLIYGFNGHAVSDTSGGSNAELVNNVIWNNAGDGVRIDSSTNGLQGWQVEANIIGKNGGYDINYSPADVSAQSGTADVIQSLFDCNTFLTTGTGRWHNLPVSPTDKVLTVSPFNNDAAGDFTLNNLPGGGAVVRQQPCTIKYRDGINSAVLIAGVAGQPPADTATGTMRSLWRELTNERFTPGDPTSAIPDATVDLWINLGMSELNRRVHYHVSDATIALVAGQQEYALPTDYVEAQWLQYGSFRKIERSDTERWMSRGEDWRHEAFGEPLSFAVYANKIILRPAPSAEAVAAAPNLSLRYVSTPASITTNGPEQLGSQDYQTAVIWGAYGFSVCYPESLVAQQRLQALKTEFEEAANLIKLDYARRNIST